MKKILIVAGGGTKHVQPFKKATLGLGIEVLIAPLSALEYETIGGMVEMKIKDVPVTYFDTLYLRVVGKHIEEAALLVNFCKEKKIKVIDSIYERDIIRLPLPKSIETKLLLEVGIPTPKTYFGSLANIKQKAPLVFGFPFVVKGTYGKQGNAVWSPRNQEELNELIKDLRETTKLKGAKFIAQEFLESPQRSRVLVIGDKAIAAITRPTRWRRRYLQEENGKIPEGKKQRLDPIPKDETRLAVEASKALGIEIAGVDILKDRNTGKLYVLEVNSAPRWESIRKDTGINVEKIILEFLSSL